MRRDGQFYMIDAFFAATILFLGIGVLVSEYVHVPEQEQPRTTLEDLADVLFSTPLYEIDNDWVLSNSAILNADLSPMQQAQIWLANESCTDCQENASKLIGNLTDDLVESQFGVQIILYPDDTETTLFNRDVLRKTDMMFARKAIIATEWNGTALLEQAEVRIWR